MNQNLFNINRRVKWVCKLRWPAVDTHRTRFMLSDSRTTLLSDPKALQSNLMKFWALDVYAPLLETTISVELTMGMIKTRYSFAILYAAYVPALDTVLIYKEQPSNWYWWHGGSYRMIRGRRYGSA